MKSNINNFLFLEKREDKYVFFGKEYENKPYFFIGKKGFVGSMLAIAIYRLEFRDYGFKELYPSAYSVLIISLVIITLIIWIYEWFEYQNLK